MKPTVKSLISCLLILLVGLFSYKYSEIFQWLGLKTYYGKYIGHKAHAFNLKDYHRGRVSLEDFKGKYLLLTFGFTRCAGVCPLNLENFRNIFKEFQDQSSSKLEFAFVSFDDLRDDATSVKEFVQRSGIKNIYGLLSGPDKALDISHHYKNDIQYEVRKIQEDETYQINHNGFVYLINPKGVLTLIYLQKNLNTQRVVEDILLLIEKEEVLDG